MEGFDAEASLKAGLFENCSEWNWAAHAKKPLGWLLKAIYFKKHKHSEVNMLHLPILFLGFPKEFLDWSD